MLTLGLSDISDHPLLGNGLDGLAYSINTDDPFIMDITLSHELSIVSTLYHWSRAEWYSYTRSVVTQILEKSEETMHFIEEQLVL